MTDPKTGRKKSSNAQNENWEWSSIGLQKELRIIHPYIIWPHYYSFEVTQFSINLRFVISFTLWLSSWRLLYDFLFIPLSRSYETGWKLLHLIFKWNYLHFCMMNALAKCFNEICLIVETFQLIILAVCTIGNRFFLLHWFQKHSLHCVYGIGNYSF